MSFSGKESLAFFEKILKDGGTSKGGETVAAVLVNDFIFKQTKHHSGILTDFYKAVRTESFDFLPESEKHRVLISWMIPFEKEEGFYYGVLLMLIFIKGLDGRNYLEIKYNRCSQKENPFSE